MQVVVFTFPFRIDIYAKDKIVASINSRELLKFEQFRRGRKPVAVGIFPGGGLRRI